MRITPLILVLLFALSCGSPIDKQQRPDVCVGVTECTDDDVCCPAGCTADNDDDCEQNIATNDGTAECGNGVLEPGETCDGDCPTSCTSTDACFGVVLSGSPDNCNVVCDQVEIDVCAAGDGCCPSNCTEETDGDCVAGCGNGILEAGELCDGNCPTTCDDGIACTRDVLSGSATTCTAMCATEPINVCQAGDSCCPSGCSAANDNDCACVPTTCAAAGARCGMIPDGCGSMLACPSTCGANESCANNQCVPATGNGTVGSPCAANGQCAGFTNAYCEIHPDYSGGYCTAACQFDNDCPTGSHCARLYSGDPAKAKICMKNCTSNAQCRPSGYACQNWDDYDQNAQVSDECSPAATGTGQTGDPCTGIADCDGGYCEDTYPGGSCTSSCFPIIGGCAATDDVCTDSSNCMPECATSLNCRTGYICILASFSNRMHCSPQ